MPESALIRAATAADGEALACIYNHYIVNTVATFEETPVSAEEMAVRVAETTAATLPWLVAETPAGVVGYAYASRWKGRCAYRHSVEVTVYLDAAVVGQGLGTLLYTALFDCLRRSGSHVASGGIALPNAASVALHEKFAMRKAAHFSEVGYKFGGWVDVGYWQLTLQEPERC